MSVSPRRPRSRGLLSRASLMVAAALIGVAVSKAPQAKAANLYWDATGADVTGGTGNWDTTSAFWSTTAAGSDADARSFTSGDIAFFTGTAGTATLTEPITIGGLVFSAADFTVTGNTLTLDVSSGAPSISVSNGNIATLSSIVAGSNGLTKSGNGTLKLTNPGNTYTGLTTISRGTLVITSGAALGADASAISILTANEVPQSTNLQGISGGGLVLDGTAAGFTLARDINFEGRGPVGERSAAILSIGDNTLSGTLTSAVSPLSPVTFRNSRINSINGTLTLSGSLVSQGTAASTFLNLGGVNTAGVANFNLTGVLSGSGSVEKSGAGTLFLNPSSVSGFTGTIRVGAAASGQQSSVRVTQASVGDVSIFGANTGTGGSSAIDMNGGVLELRSAGDLNFNALAGGKNVYHRASSTLYAGPAAGGDTINGLATFGTFRLAANTTGTFNSRNGYGMTFQAWTQESSNNSSTITNNMGGTLTFTGDAWNNNDGSDRTLNLRGTGTTVVTGSVDISGAGIKSLSKKGTGTWEIRGTATDIQGEVAIDNGVLVITDFRSIANNTATIQIGSNASNSNLNSTNNHGAGALIIGTSSSATAAGLTTSKVINLQGTTNGATIYANQALASPVIINANLTATGAGAKTLTLGGLNAADNIISGVIPNNSATNTTALTKVGSGTWVLAGANTYTGLTTIVNGTLKLKANAATSTVLPVTNDITFGNNNVFAGGTLEFVGQPGINNVQDLDVLTSTSGAATIRLTPGAGGTASLTFASQAAANASATVNFVGADFVSNKFTITGANGLLGRTYYWNGADFAYRESNVLRAPAYGTDSGFTTSATALTASANMQVTGSFATNTVSISTLKVAGSHTLTLNSAQTLTLSNGGVLVTGGDAVIKGGTALALGTQALVVRANLPTDTLSIQSVITGSGGLTKGGAGTLVLAAANTQTGTISINEGTVRLSGSGRLGAANASLTMRQGTVLDLDGVTPSTNTDAFNSNGSVTSATPATFTVGANNGTGSSFGTVDGALSLTKLGTGAQSWLGNSTYTGVTTIGSTGLVTVDTLADIGQNSGIGRGDATSDATNAASLVFNGTTGGLLYRGDTLNGLLTLGSRSASTNRLFTLAATSTGATLSSTASNNNAVVWSNLAPVVNNTSANAVLVLTGASAGDNTFNPQLSDSSVAGITLGLNKTAAGQWNLGNSSNTYTGLTLVGDGILALNQAGALPANSPLVLGSTTTSGTLQASGVFARDLAATAVAGTGTITFGGTTGGGGFAAHTTPLTVTLSSNAALTWGTGGFVPSGAQLLLGSASALSDVTFTNPINFGGAKRTINVVDNGNTGADYATLSGVLSGDAGIGYQKTGNTVLRTTGANTYTGVTDINAGALVVTSLGLGGSGAATSSVGAAGAGVTMDNSNAVTIGNASTSNAVLQYVGPGETSDRKIRINATTGTSAGAQIHADGTGPLILTNVANDMVSNADSKVLWLRGNSPYVNQIQSVLANNGGALNVTVDGGTAWVLTNSGNSYTGTTTAGAGALGIGDNAALGASNLTISNGNVFAHGADRVLTNVLNLANNAASSFLGDYSLTFNGTNNLAAGGNNVTLNNGIVAGKSVTFAGMTSAATANRSWTIDGPGTTVINGNFTTSTSFWVRIDKAGDGTLVLGTSGTGSNWNTVNSSVSAIDLDRGTLRFSANEAIPSGAGSGGLLISPELVAFDTATVDLNGTTQTVNGLTATSDGTVRLDNTSASPAAFRFGANNATVDFGSGVGSYSVQNAGAGALSLVKLGNSSVTFNSGITLANKGEIAVEGGSFAVTGQVTAAAGLRAIGSSTLALTGGITNPGLMRAVEVGAGSTLTLLDGAGTAFAGLTSLKLGDTGTGTATLNLNVGTDATDTFTLPTGGMLALGGTVTFNLTDAGLDENTTYTLLNLADGGISAFGLGNMLQGAMPGGFDALTWSVSDNQVTLSTGNLITGALYWRGQTSTAWNGAANNWSTDKAGAVASTTFPGAGTDVIFSHDGASGALTTTLEQNYRLNSLTFESGATTPASVTINPGTNLASRLEVSDHITLSAGAPAAVTLATNYKIGAAQTWTVADAATTLTFSGALLGAADVTKAGLGKVVLSAAADPTFNAAQTFDLTIAAGTFEIQNVASLGSLANANVANVVLNGGAFYYANATGGTLPNPITLAGGALSGAGNNHTYSGAVTVTSASTINLADANGPGSATARNITLSGPLTGTAGLTIDGNNAASGGNQLAGTLTLNHAASTWSGPLTFNRGTVSIEAAASAGLQPTDISFASFGRCIVKGVDGRTIDRSGALVLAAAAAGEFQVDNTTATQVTDFVVNQNGAVTLGAGSALRVALPDQLARLNIVGTVTLAGDASISVSNALTRILTISGVVGETGGARALSINDDLGVWAQTNGIVRLTAANTFTGNLAVGEGVVEFDTVSNIGGGASNLGQGSAITLAGGNLRFVGAVSQSTNRPISTSESSTLSAHGTGGATITYAARLTQSTNNALTLTGADATAAGHLTGGVTQVGTSADLNVNSGAWTLSGAASVLADDIIVNGTSAILNLNGASLISFTTGTSNGLYVRSGATVNLLSNDVFGPANSGSLDFIFLGDNAAGGGRLNVNGFTIETPRLDLGQRVTDYEAQIDGAGTVFVKGGAIDLFRGIVNAGLASDGSAALEKYSTGTVTLKGDNSGLASTGSTLLYEGTLVLDYSTNNLTKVRAASALDMRGAALALAGNAGAASAQTVGGLTLGSGGASVITLLPAAGQDLLLSLGAITRAVNAQDGTLRVNLPAGTQSATHGVTTSTGLTGGLLGSAGYVTADDGTGVWFATKSADNIVALASAEKNNVTTWNAGEHVTDAGLGYSGTLSAAYPGSVRFNATGGSSVTLASSGILGVATGGILVTSNVGGASGLNGGVLFSGAQASNVPEIIVTQDSASVFEIGADLRTNLALTKSGSGTLRLSGNNTYNGYTEILNGTLQLSGGGAVGDASIVTLAAYRNSTLQLLADETIGRLQGGQRQTNSDNGMVDLGAFTLTLNQSGNTNYTGRFTGTGTIILNAGNTGNLNYNGQTSTGLFTGSVVVNGGLFQLSGDTARLGSATSFTINGAGNLLLDNDNDTNITDRISDSAAFTLNSAAGSWSGSTIVRGLAMRNNDNDDAFEVIGQITFGGGANYVALEASGGTSAQSRIVSTGWARNNDATLNVRGRNLGATADSTGRTQFKVQDANDAAMLAANVGGGGTIGGTAKNVSILPWAVGESITAGLADANMGNTFLSYVDNRGFVPLSHANEFSTFSAASAGHNVRESVGADLTDIAGLTVNSLILNNTAFVGLDVTGAGAGNALTLTSGALMFTVSGGAASTAYDTTLGGFAEGIKVGATNEYVIHVINPSSAATTSTLSATISSPLNSAADITKSGRGTLILTGANAAGGGSNKTTLNEGVLQISDLDQIGGNSGALVFAGGTLRLGAGFADDLSMRAISILEGGATIDTNGVDLALANSVGAGAGGLIKTGSGILTLNGAATYAGLTVVNAGTLAIGVSGATGVGGNLTVNAGATVALGVNDITAGLVTVTGAGAAITGSGTITATAGFVFNPASGLTVDAVLAGAGGVFKGTNQEVILTGSNTYTGITEVQDGILRFNSIANVGAGASALGAPATVENGIIRLGRTNASVSDLRYVGSGHSSDRLLGLQGTTGTGVGAKIYADGTGALGLGGVRMENAGDKILSLRGISASGVVNTLGAIRQLGGVLTLNKTDANTWELSGANVYTGATQVDNGLLRFIAAGALPAASSLRLGAAGTAGSVEIIGHDQTTGALNVQSTLASTVNQLRIDSGRTLTLTGAVTLGSMTSATATVLQTAGGGHLVVSNPITTGTTFRAGGHEGNLLTVDLTGLASLTVDLHPVSGVFQVSSASGTNSTGYATLSLPDSVTVTAGALTLGGGGAYNGNAGQVNQLRLGAGVTRLNVGALNIGTGSRDLGSLVFAGAGGSIEVRAADGVSATPFNMATGTANTGVLLSTNQNTFDVTGHQASLKFGAVNIGTQNRNAGLLNVFSFDTGTLEIGSLNASAKGANGNTTTTIINLGGGVVTTGSWTLASTTGNGVAEATANLTGGTITFSGDILRGADSAGGGTATGTVNLNGATLSMAGFAIGSDANPVVFNAQAGTLRDVGTLNGAGGLTKSGAGLLTIEGASAFTGATTVSEGTLQIASESNLGAAPTSFVAGQLTLGAASTQGGMKTTGTTTLNANRGVALEAGGGAFDVADATTLTIGSAVTGVGALTKNGAGVLDLKMGTPQYGGTTTINGGTLRFTNVADLGAVSTMVFNINNGSTLEFRSSVGGSNRTVLNNKTFTFGGSGGGTINFNGGNNLMQNGVHNFATTGGSKNTISQTNDGYINNQGTGNTVFNVADGADAVDLELSVRWANGTLTKGGVGTMAITGVHTGNYDLDIDAGVLEVGGSSSLNGGAFTAAITNDGTFKYGSSAAQAISGIISGGGAVTKAGSGTLTLSGANTFAGATLVSAGTLTASAGSLAGTSGITVNGAILEAVDFNLAATLALDSSATATISGSGLNITGAVTNAGSTDDALNFSATTGKITLISLAGSGKTRFGSDADITGGVSAGTVTVVGSLGADVTGGTVSAGSLSGDVSGGSVTVTNLLTGAVSSGTVSAGSLTGNVSGGSVTVTNLLTGNVTAGTVSAGAMTGDVSSSVMISGLLTGAITAGTNALGSLSSSSVTGGTNTITGAATVTTVDGGTTSIGGVATITTLTSGTVTLTGATAAIGALNGGTVALGTTALTVDGGTFAGVISGLTGSLIKATNGTLTLSGTNTFGGGTTLSAGTLTLGNVSALGTGAINVASGATLNLNNLGVSNAITVATGGNITGGPQADSPAVLAKLTGSNSIDTVLTGSVGLEKTDGGELTLSTPNFFTGAVEANVAGAVIKAAFLADTSSSLGTSTLTDPANLVLGSGATLEFTGGTSTSTARSFTIGGSAGIAATGTGTLEFTSASQLATTGAAPALTLTANNAGTNRFAASLVDGNTGLANLAINGTGIWVIGTGANRFKNDVRIEAAAGATIGLENASLPSGATLAVANNATIRWEAGNATGVKLEIAAGTAAKLNLGSNNVVFSIAPVVASGSGTTANFEKQGSGTLTIGASVNAGAVNFTLPENAGMLSVGTGGSIGNVSLATGSRLGGSGTVGAVTAAAGSTIAPGNSPGVMTAASMTIAGNTTFLWEVQDALAGPGVGGYDKMVISGSLDLTGASAINKITLKINSLTADGVTIGDAINFGAPNGVSSIRTFEFASVQTGSSGVLLGSGLNISDVFQFDLSQFTYTGGGTSNAALWSIDWNQGTGAITLTAVPEPSTYGFGLGALALAAAAIRRRKRQAKA